MVHTLTTVVSQNCPYSLLRINKIVAFFSENSSKMWLYRIKYVNFQCFVNFPVFIHKIHRVSKFATKTMLVFHGERVPLISGISNSVVYIDSPLFWNEYNSKNQNYKSTHLISLVMVVGDMVCLVIGNNGSAGIKT